MEYLWIGLSLLLGCMVFFLCLKILYMRKASREIRKQLAEILSTDTNLLITISSSDRELKALAQNLNKELKILRAEQIRYQQGDIELKNAITNISHDLRTPLTAIFGYLKLLEEETLSPQAEKYLEIISERSTSIQELTEELLRYTASVSEKPDLILEPVILNHVLEESISSFYAAFKEKNISPVIELCEQNVTAQLNKDALSRIFSNILNNAMKYSDGDLYIKLSEEDEITFANHACSVDEVAVGRLFDRFYTVNTANKSTGLGLSIAKHLTEQMGGSISAELKDGILSIHLIFPQSTPNSHSKESTKYFSLTAGT